MPVPLLWQRLARLRREGNLTTADLARWLERPHATVSGWLRGGEVGLTSLDAAYIVAQVSRLERMVGKGGLPVPRMVRAKRREYLEKLKNGRVK